MNGGDSIDATLSGALFFLKNWNYTRQAIHSSSCAGTSLIMRGAIFVVFTSLLALQTANALSYSVCDTVAEEWTTDSPRLTGSWPYYNLLHT